eukprot:TRINITY_DN4534_c0_g1_i1.p2 TRINITY_DN4534_c0_g1~~TRINITY_DN4534_c0_g1_i1.p2  ORF type:complete len:74 (-),score=10.68 TRINITY_DN4534_c0_g1_i1:71-292(-)
MKKKMGDATVFESNTWIASPNGSPPAFRFLYVDGFTGSMSIKRNAIVAVTRAKDLTCVTGSGLADVKAKRTAA